MNEQDELYNKLLEYANTLRRMTNSAYPEYPADVVRDIDAAIVFLDCARQKLINNKEVESEIDPVIQAMRNLDKAIAPKR